MDKLFPDDSAYEIRLTPHDHRIFGPGVQGGLAYEVPLDTLKHVRSLLDIAYQHGVRHGANVVIDAVKE